MLGSHVHSNHWSAILLLRPLAKYGDMSTPIAAVPMAMLLLRLLPEYRAPSHFLDASYAYDDDHFMASDSTCKYSSDYSQWWLLLQSCSRATNTLNEQCNTHSYTLQGWWFLISPNSLKLKIK